MRLPIIASLTLLSSAAWAEAPWGTVDLPAGQALHEKNCTSCHVRQYGGDGSKMYTRERRIVANQRELLQRVAFCNTSVNAGLFPDEEANIAAWLNQRYYHFTN